MAYQTVKSLAEWQQALNHVTRRVIAMKSIVQQVQRAENTAGRSGAIDWPIDDLAGELMYSRAAAAGPFKQYDDEIDAALAASFRYAYTIQPGRPSTYLCGMFSREQQTRMNLYANAGTPFSAAYSGGTGDLVRISWTASTGEQPVYENILVAALLDSGLGIGLYAGDGAYSMEHLNNSSITGNADYWSLGADWEYNGDTIRVTAAAVTTSTNLVQRHGELNHPFVNGVTYRVEVNVVRTGGDITPKIGTVAGSVINSTSTSVQYITCDENDADFTLDAALFDGTIQEVYITPVLWEHVSNGRFVIDPATYGHWTYAGNWVYDAANDWMEDNGVAIAAVTKLQQLTADMTHACDTDVLYRLNFEAATSAGKIRPILGDAVGYWVDDVAVTQYTQHLRSSAGLDLEFESDGVWQGHVTNVSVFHEDENDDGPLVVKLQQTDE